MTLFLSTAQVGSERGIVQKIKNFYNFLYPYIMARVIPKNYSDKKMCKALKDWMETKKSNKDGFIWWTKNCPSYLGF